MDFSLKLRFDDWSPHTNKRKVLNIKLLERTDFLIFVNLEPHEKKILLKKLFPYNKVTKKIKTFLNFQKTYGRHHEDNNKMMV